MKYLLLISTLLLFGCSDYKTENEALKTILNSKEIEISDLQKKVDVLQIEIQSRDKEFSLLKKQLENVDSENIQLQYDISEIEEQATYAENNKENSFFISFTAFIAIFLINNIFWILIYKRK